MLQPADESFAHKGLDDAFRIFAVDILDWFVFVALVAHTEFITFWKYLDQEVALRISTPLFMSVVARIDAFRICHWEGEPGTLFKASAK
jgi:hypothetical protein